MAILSRVVGQNVFLQGNFLSVGIGATGSFGTSIAAPSGIFTDTAHGFTNLGIYADLDGFGRGALPTFRDVAVPGTPEERFNIGYRTSRDGSAIVTTNSDLVSAGTALPVSSVRNVSDGRTLGARWIGEDENGLKTTQTVSFDASDTYMKVTVKLTNTSDRTFYDLRYMRNIDPDQSPSFDTENHIFRQGPGGALAAAYVPGGTSPFFYFSNDSRAVVANFGFTNTDPYAPEVTTDIQPEGYTTNEDNALAIAFNIGRLAAGASTTLTFYLGVAPDLDEVIDEILPDIEGPENRPPVAAADSRTVTEDATSLDPRVVTGNLLSNDSDPDGDALRVTALAGLTVGTERVLEGRYGTLTLRADGSYSYAFENTDALIAGETGTERFSYTIADADGRTDNAVLTLTIDGADLRLTVAGTFVAHRGDDSITGMNGADRLTGRAGDDVLRGADGNDSLWGEDGNDRILGEVGDDLGIGGAGDDTIELGLGDDRGWGEAGDDRMAGGDGNDRIDAGTGNDAVDLGRGDDRGWGGIGNDSMIGSSGADWLNGEAGEDVLIGGDGDDDLWGEAHDDRLDGGTGNDVLSAGLGNDTIITGAGNDTAWGGGGSDRFLFSAGFGRDVIKDFEAGDRIVFDGVFSNFSAVENAMRQDGRDVVIAANGQTITIENVTRLDAGDFQFI